MDWPVGDPAAVAPLLGGERGLKLALPADTAPALAVAPLLGGERGLKQWEDTRPQRLEVVAPLLGGERGLKLRLPAGHDSMPSRSSLRRGAWVETDDGRRQRRRRPVAPLLGGERGLKPGLAKIQIGRAHV